MLGFINRIIGFIKRQLRQSWGSLCFCFSGRRRDNAERLKGLSNRYQGSRCFIVCNGPSLKVEDLERIHENGDFSFASNKIDKIFPQTAWRPSFYTIMDETYQYTMLETMKKVPADIKFFRRNSYSVTRKAGGNCVWLNADGDRALLENPKFAEDCTDVVYTIATVTYTMFELAVHMGFRELYIIGCDNSYGIEKRKDGTIVKHGTASYFAGSDEKSDKIAGATWEMNVAYEYARKYADAHGIKIMNATRGGHLEAFERVDFDTLF